MPDTRAVKKILSCLREALLSDRSEKNKPRTEDVVSVQHEELASQTPSPATCRNYKPLSVDDFRKEFMPGNGKIPVCEVIQLLELARETGTPVRIDFSRGFTVAGFKLLSICKQAGISPLVMFPAVSAGDAVYVRQGQAWWAPEVVDLLGRIHHEFTATFGFLVDSAEIISRVLTRPTTVWKSLADEIGRQGITVEGIGCSLRNTLTARLNLLWCYRACGRLRGEPLLRLLRNFEFESLEWGYLTRGHSDSEFAEPLDGIRYIEAKAVYSFDPVYVRGIAVTTNFNLQVIIHPAGGKIVFTDESGWKIIDNVVERNAGTGEIISTFSRDNQAPVGILIIDADHLIFEDSPRLPIPDLDQQLRRLPYPYTHFLAINSDIDWSDWDMFARSMDYFHYSLGIPLSASLYLESSDPRWPAWNQFNEKVERYWSCGALDTIHGITYSHDTLEWKAREFDENFECIWQLEVDFSGYKGLWIESSACNKIPEIELITSLHPRGLRIVPEMSNVDVANGIRYTVLPFDDHSASSITGVTGIRLCGNIQRNDDRVTVRTYSRLAKHVQADLDELARREYRPIVFTSHGGGEGTRRYGSCVDEDWRCIAPDEARLAFDRPESPWYCIEEFARLGTVFFNPNGNAFSLPTITSLKNILREEVGQNGKHYYMFSRFMSQRHSKLNLDYEFNYGKHAATAQGFSANIYDILQQMSWSELGTGAILYTHLGHRLGSQLVEGLRWNDEMLGSLNHLVSLAHPLQADERPMLRIWVATASQVLAYSAMMKNLAKNSVIDGSTIHIQPWYDHCLRRMLGTTQDAGSAWLHGATFYVNDPESAKVIIDSQPYHFFTINPPDQSGMQSVTLVSSDDVQRVSHGQIDIRSGEFSALFLNEKGDLANVTHISFLVKNENKSDLTFEISFDNRVQTINLAGRHCSSNTNGVPWRQVVLAFNEIPGARPLRGRVEKMKWSPHSCPTREYELGSSIVIKNVLLHRWIPKGGERFMA